MAAPFRRVSFLKVVHERTRSPSYCGTAYVRACCVFDAYEFSVNTWLTCSFNLPCPCSRSDERVLWRSIYCCPYIVSERQLQAVSGDTL